jgi:hypothetical protein
VFVEKKEFAESSEEKHSPCPAISRLRINHQSIINQSDRALNGRIIRDLEMKTTQKAYRQSARLPS